MKIINLLKQKKMMENTSDQFDPENTNKTVWNDLRDLQRDAKIQELESIEQYSRDQLISGAVADVDDGDASKDASRMENVKESKKKELRDQRQILMQFDKLAKNFDRSVSTAGDSMQVVQKGTGKMVDETASMLKKKTKQKKEKSLSAKLRLKTKKSK